MAWYDRLLAVAKSALERANDALEAVVEATAPEPPRRPDRQPAPQPRPRRRARPRRQSTRSIVLDLQRQLEAEQRARSADRVQIRTLEIALARETRRRERAEETARRRRERPQVIYPIPIAGRKRPPNDWLRASNLTEAEARAHFDDFHWVPNRAKSIVQFGPRDYRLYVDDYYLAHHPPGYLPPPRS